MRVPCRASDAKGGAKLVLLQQHTAALIGWYSQWKSTPAPHCSRALLLSNLPYSHLAAAAVVDVAVADSVLYGLVSGGKVARMGYYSMAERCAALLQRHQPALVTEVGVLQPDRTSSFSLVECLQACSLARTPPIAA